MSGSERDSQGSELLIRTGSLAGRRYPLPPAPDSITIGREKGCAVQFDPNIDKVVGRHHAQIVHDVDGFYLVDLNSRNGTWLGNSPIRHRVRLHNGDVFQLGEDGPRLEVRITQKVVVPPTVLVPNRRGGRDTSQGPAETPAAGTEGTPNADITDGQGQGGTPARAAQSAIAKSASGENHREQAVRRQPMTSTDVVENRRAPASVALQKAGARRQSGGGRLVPADPADARDQTVVGLAHPLARPLALYAIMFSLFCVVGVGLALATWVLPEPSESTAGEAE